MSGKADLPHALDQTWDPRNSPLGLKLDPKRWHWQNDWRMNWKRWTIAHLLKFQSRQSSRIIKTFEKAEVKTLRSRERGKDWGPSAARSLASSMAPFSHLTRLKILLRENKYQKMQIPISINVISLEKVSFLEIKNKILYGISKLERREK